MRATTYVDSRAGRKHENPRARDIVRRLSPAQWKVLHQTALLPAPMKCGRVNSMTYAKLTDLELIEIDSGLRDWVPTGKGLQWIDDLAKRLGQQRESVG